MVLLEQKFMPDIRMPEDSHYLLQLSGVYWTHVRGEDIPDEMLLEGYQKVLWISEKAKLGVEYVRETISKGKVRADLDAYRMMNLVGTVFPRGEDDDYYYGEYVIDRAEVLERWSEAKIRGEQPNEEDEEVALRLVKFAFENPDWYKL